MSPWSGFQRARRLFGCAPTAITLVHGSVQVERRSLQALVVVKGAKPLARYARLPEGKGERRFCSTKTYLVHREVDGGVEFGFTDKSHADAFRLNMMQIEGHDRPGTHTEEFDNPLFQQEWMRQAKRMCEDIGIDAEFEVRGRELDVHFKDARHHLIFSQLRDSGVIYDTANAIMYQRLMMGRLTHFDPGSPGADR